ncbi:RagB/SusD family nutrient uptake outer membrane protein [Sphingobacterium sp. JB170]|uniref:RagB/SusD family nutrient uptake outer membrane protein n=1 Tax=Sphingobacterium sp. JB170 TaxID=1434842 RepID=UPI00097EFF1B|nr:RagB/SusD family nutrient uptake outer membrane protein [Sphingobacterium sp. JB170]SJN47913.1 putative outer membrane protein, probably involved in nutrient binding [Sphingobacterium sp. JB170]
MKKVNSVNKICLLIFAVYFLVCNTACEKFLDEKSTATTTSPNNLESFQMLLDNANVMNVSFPTFGEISADNYFLTDETFNGLNEFRRGDYIWDWPDYEYVNDWARGYHAVYVSNLVLDGLGELEVTSSNRKQYEDIYASALFYRAYSFLSMLWTYSLAYDENASENLGIVLRKTSNPVVVSQRSSVQECYDQIISDLKKCTTLPMTTGHVLRPSKVAVYGTLARTYLSMRDYQQAYNYADSALVLYDNLLDFNDAQDTTGSDDYPFTRYNKETIYFSTLTLTANNWNTDTSLYQSYKDSDLRKSLFFKPLNENYEFKGSYSGDYWLFSGLTTGELLLIKAESAAFMDSYDQARSVMRVLMAKRYSDDGELISLNALPNEQLLQFIRTERRKEMIFRGQRWIDIKRFNKEGLNIDLTRIVNGEVYELPANDLRFALPLPHDIILETGMQQNPK